MPVPVAELFVTVGADASGAINAINQFSQQIRRVGANLQSAGGDLTKGVTAPIVASVGVVAKFGATFEDNMQGVRKTANLTADETKDLGQELLNASKTIQGGGFDADELAKTAKVAGQLGIPKEQLGAFTTFAARFANATDQSSTAAAEDLSVIKTLNKVGSDQFENLGSTIVALGNDMEGSEAQIQDVAKRISGTFHALGFSIQDTLAFSSAVIAAGLNPEEGASALQRLSLQIASAVAGPGQVAPEAAKKIQDYNDKLTDLGTSLAAAEARQAAFGRNTPAATVQANAAAIEKYKREIAQTRGELDKLGQGGNEGELQAFATLAGKTTEEFKALQHSSPADALQAVVEGLAKIGESGGSDAVVKALADANITNVRDVQTLLGLAVAHEKLAKARQIANDAFAEGTALQTENELRSQSTLKQFELLKNELKAIAIEAWPGFKAAAAEAIATIKTDVIPALASLRDWWLKLDPAMQGNIIKFLALAAALGPILFGLGVFISVIGSLFNPIIILAALIGLLAAAWLTNWGNIKGKVLEAADAIIANIDKIGPVLKFLMAGAIVAAAVIGNAIGGLIVKFAAFATAWLLNAAKVAVGWIIAAGPVALFLLAIASAITAVDLFRHAWDENIGDIQGKAVALAEVLKGLANIRLALALTPEAKAGAQESIDNIQGFIDRVKEGQSALPQFQGAADALNVGETFAKQFDQGFPQIQQNLKAALSGAVSDPTLLTAAGLGPQAVTRDIAAGAAGLTPTVDQGLARVGAFAQVPASVDVTINNPVVLDANMLAQMQGQAMEVMAQALITAEQATDSPPPVRLPGQPFFVPGASQ